MTGDELKRWRKVRKIAVPTLAKIAGVDRGIIRGYEAGLVIALEPFILQKIKQGMQKLEESINAV